MLLCPADLRRSWVNVLWICPSLPVVPSHLPTHSQPAPSHVIREFRRQTRSSSPWGKMLLARRRCYFVSLIRYDVLSVDYDAAAAGNQCERRGSLSVRCCVQLVVGRTCCDCLGHSFSVSSARFAAFLAGLDAELWGCDCSWMCTGVC